MKGLFWKHCMFTTIFKKELWVSTTFKTSQQGSPGSEPTNCCERTFTIHRNELSSCSEPGNRRGHEDTIWLSWPSQKSKVQKKVETSFHHIPYDDAMDNCTGDAADREALPYMLHLVPSGCTTAGSGLHPHFHLLLLWLGNDNTLLDVGKILTVCFLNTAPETLLLWWR